jgi:MFS family permease
MLLAGRLGDLVRRRRVFLLGMIVTLFPEPREESRAVAVAVLRPRREPRASATGAMIPACATASSTSSHGS